MNARNDMRTLTTRPAFMAGMTMLLLLLLAAPASLFGQVCSPTGAHGKHAPFDCKNCHVVGGVECFDPAGKAFSPYLPAPYYNPASQSCSNVACHSVLPGTFSYYFQGGDGSAELHTVNYGSPAGNSTPSWFQTAPGCTACHPNPPRFGTDGSNVWHSGNHAGSLTSSTNQCQFCHPDASGVNNQGTTITDPSLHANGTVNVEAAFRSYCFNCH